MEGDLAYVTDEKEKLEDRLASVLHLCDNTWKDVRRRFSSSEALEAFVPREEEQPHLLCDLLHSILAHEQRRKQLERLVYKLAFKIISSYRIETSCCIYYRGNRIFTKLTAEGARAKPLNATNETRSSV